MKAAWYERNGPAREVLRVGEQPDPVPGRGEVLVRLVKGKAFGTSPFTASWLGTTAASATAACSMSALSSSKGLIR